MRLVPGKETLVQKCPLCGEKHEFFYVDLDDYVEKQQVYQCYRYCQVDPGLRILKPRNAKRKNGYGNLQFKTKVNREILCGAVLRLKDIEKIEKKDADYGAR